MLFSCVTRDNEFAPTPLLSPSTLKTQPVPPVVAPATPRINRHFLEVMHPLLFTSFPGNAAFTALLLSDCSCTQAGLQWKQDIKQNEEG